jgi:hypothetical protein
MPKLGPALPGYVYREKKQTVMDIYRRQISGRLEREIETVAVEVTLYCKRHHAYQNRTGALERSIGYEKPKRTPRGVQTVIFAGGPSLTKYTYNFGLRKAKKRRRRNVSYIEGHRVRLRRGSYIWVNYARYVKDKGFPVLRQGIDHYKRQIARIIAHNLRVRRIR